MVLGARREVHPRPPRFALCNSIEQGARLPVDTGRHGPGAAYRAAAEPAAEPTGALNSGQCRLVPSEAGGHNAPKRTSAVW